MKPIFDKTLFDHLGNRCRVEVHDIGSNVEAYFHDFNDATPRRYVGEAGLIQNHVEIWLAMRKEEGWIETTTKGNTP